MSSRAKGPERTYGQVERNVRSLARWRWIFGVLMIVVPAGLLLLFERQARRLDALGDHGAPTTATVDRVTRQGSETFVEYEYAVDGTTYTWSAAQRDAPHAVGETFPVTYLPEAPALNRPGTDRSKATAEAASNRSFAWKVEGAAFYFFAVNLILCDVRLRRLRRTGQTELTDVSAYRTRLILTGVLLLAPMLALVFGWHAQDALRRHESLWPVVLGGLLAVGVLGGTGFYVLREGREHVAARSARMVRWAVPIALTVAVLRALAWLVAR